MRNLTSFRNSLVSYTLKSKSYVNKIERRLKTDSASKDDILQPTLNEDQMKINKEREKLFRLEPADQRRLCKLPPLLSEEEKNVMDLKSYRKLYGEYGNAAGIDVAALWPSKEEMALQREYEQVAFPHTIQTMIKLEKERKQIELEEILKKQETIKKNLEKLDGWMSNVKQKMVEQEHLAKERIAKKKQQIEDVRKMLGYNIDPKDQKFIETVELLEEEEKKRLKKEKKIHKKQKVIDELRAIAEREAKAHAEPIVEGTEVPPLPSTDAPRDAR